MYKIVLFFIALLLMGGASYGQRVVGNPNVVTLDLGGWAFGNYLQAPATQELKPGRDYCHTLSIINDTLFIYSCALGKWIVASGSGGVSTVHGINGITINGGDTVDGKLKMNIADSVTGYVTHATFIDSLRALFDRNVTSVNGLTGPSITLITDNISEGGSNLWFTDSRAIDANIAQIADSVRGRVKYIDSNTRYYSKYGVDTAKNNIRSWANLSFLRTETDPVFTASPSYGISNGNITNWNIAYSKYPTGLSFTTGTLTLTSNDASSLPVSMNGWWIKYSDTSTFSITLKHLNTILAGYLTAEVDPIFTASAAHGIGNTDITNWNTAYNGFTTTVSMSSSLLTLTKHDGSTATASVPTFNQNTIGSAGTLSPGRNINGTLFDGSSAITITASANTLTTTTLNPTVVNSSLQTLATIITGTWTATPIADAYIASAANWNSKQPQINGTGFVKASGTTISYDNSTYLTTSGATSTYVPYTGATGNVNIGSNSLYLTGSLGIGTTSPATPLEVVETVTVTPRGITNTQISNTTNPAQVHLRKSRGVVGSLLSVISGDVIGREIFDAYDGSSYVQTADIRATITNTVTTNSVPSQLSFYVSSNAVPSVMSEKLRIYSDGSINYFGSTSGMITMLPPASITNYTITPPSSIGSLGQVESISSVAGNVATLGWITPLTSFSVTASSVFSVTGSPITGGAGTINIAFAPTTVFTITPANSVTVDGTNGNSQTITMNRATTTFTISNIPEGRQNAITLEVLQDVTGGRGLAMATTVKVPNHLNGIPPHSNGSGDIDLWTIFKIHGNIWVIVTMGGS